MPASQTTSVGFTPYSEMIFTSIEAKPKIAFVGCPLEVAIDSGSAKKARYTRLFPSIRNSSFDDSGGTSQHYRRGRPRPAAVPAPANGSGEGVGFHVSILS